MDDLVIENGMEEDESDGITDENVFSDAVIWGTDWTTETIALQIARGNINLNPDFQRRDAWSKQNKSKLIESLILGIPVPPIVLAEDQNNRNHYIVIDGKQRLLSIMQFYMGNKKISEEIKNSRYDLLKLTGLEVLPSLNKKDYSEIPDKYLSNIDNGTIRTIAIKNWPNENFLYTVFLTLNTGSLKLSTQELRQALKPGPFLSYLDKASANSNSIMKMLNNSSSDKRMRDVELALRFFGFKYFMQEYKGNLRAFLDYTCENLNKMWEEKKTEYEEYFKELENAIDFSFELFESYPFSRYLNKKSTKSFNRCIFELFSYYFSDRETREKIGNKKESFVEAFLELNDDPLFEQSVLAYPKVTEKVVRRFNMFSNMLTKIDNSLSFQKFEYFGASIEVV